jgi:hypothetical protein
LKNFRHLEFFLFLIFVNCAVKGTDPNLITNLLKVNYCKVQQDFAVVEHLVQSGISDKLLKTGITSNFALPFDRFRNTAFAVEMTPHNYTENVIQKRALQMTKVLPKVLSDNSIVQLIYNGYSKKKATNTE